MKPLLLLLAFSTIIISSCTTAYKTGQTPDDVYYSPVRPQEEYVRVDNNNIDNRTNGGTEQYYEDRQLRMKVHNPARWSELDDWYYYNNRYNYFGNYNPLSWNNPWNNYTYWNYYYNPYCPKVIVLNPKSVATYNKPRVFNLNTYNNPLLNNNSGRNVRTTGNNNTYSNNTYNTNSRRDAGSTLRDIFRGSNNNSSSSSTSHPNSSTNSSSNSGSSGSSSGSSSSSGNAPVRKF